MKDQIPFDEAFQEAQAFAAEAVQVAKAIDERDAQRDPELRDPMFERDYEAEAQELATMYLKLYSRDGRLVP